MEFVRDTNINFVGTRKIAYFVSSALILIAFVSLILHGGPNYGIDFRGGTAIQLKFEKPVQIGQIRSSLAEIGLGGAEIKHFGSSDEVLIRVEEQENPGGLQSQIVQQISKSLPDNPLEVRRTENVGPKIGRELRRAAIYAVFISLGLLLIYISWRFEFKFAVGAVVALFHDVVITLGVFSILNQEISLAVVAAFLTLVGYSLNDTIVVYDRIRENLKIFRRETYETIINRSINQNLSRTIITSLTTFVVVFILFLIGGEIIRGLSLALLVGVIVGTYSSIYVASPIVIEWRNWTEAKKAGQRGRR